MIVLLFALLGGLIYRLRGGWFLPQIPMEIWRIIFILPYIIFAILTGIDYISLFALMIALIVGVSLGHGSFQDMGTWINPSKPERIETLIEWIKPHICPFGYDFIGMCLSGLFMTIWVGIFTHNPLIGLSGLMKGPAYALAWKLNPNAKKYIFYPTEWGEFLTGFFLWGILGIIGI